MPETTNWICPVCGREHEDTPVPPEDRYASFAVACARCGAEIRLVYDEMCTEDHKDCWGFYTAEQA